MIGTIKHVRGGLIDGYCTRAGGCIGHLPGVILGALLLAALPEVLRYVAGPLQAMTDGRLDAAILRQLLIALAMVTIMLWKPRGLWPTPEHGKNLNPQGGAR